MRVKVEGKKKNDTEGKSASDIKFSSGKPSFGSGPPKFKSTAKMSKEQFPEIGGKVGQKDESTKDEAPTMKGPNRFEGLQDRDKESRHDHKDGHKKYDDKFKKGPRKPREEKDEFFSNFRNNNKDIVAKESDPKPTEKSDSAPTASADGPPKFNFTNNKKGAMTMAKAQEDAAARKAEFDKEIEQENKKKEEEAKRRENRIAKDKFKDDKFKDGKNKPHKNDEFRKHDKPKEDKKKHEDVKKTEEKPKAKPAKAPKEIKEAADLKGVNEWGEGKLEDFLK